ncbi:Arc family DNA-binding protein [Pseudomonas sp. PB3P13]
MLRRFSSLTPLPCFQTPTGNLNENAARVKGRSPNSEILARLETSFTDAALPAEETRKRFDELTYAIRHFEGSLNRGFNHLATTVY